MIAEITSTNWVELLTPIAVAVAIIMQKLQADKVKVALQDSTAKADDKLTAIHGLVNGNVTESKRVTAMQAKRIADLTKDPADIAAYVDAQKAYSEQSERHKKIDEEMSKKLALEHRSLVSDGPIVALVNERLDRIENIISSLSCAGKPGDQCSDPKIEPKKT